MLALVHVRNLLFHYWSLCVDAGKELALSLLTACQCYEGTCSFVIGYCELALERNLRFDC